MKLTILVGLAFVLGSGAAESIECDSDLPQLFAEQLANTPLPVRNGPQTHTSGSVPHVQVGVKPDAEVTDELLRLVFTLPGVEKRPTIVSLPGATGIWLADDVPIVHPKAIVSGREFAHIHPDGSLHAPLPLERALELSNKGWGERHPWAERRAGWEGLVMLYSVSVLDELPILIRLITESYYHVTGLNVLTPNC